MILQRFNKTAIGRPLVILVSGLLIAIVALDTAPLRAQQGSRPGRKLTLSDQLMLGLRARTKADKVFLDKVVTLVEQGKLPRAVVDSTFLWARERAVQHSRLRRLRPLVYFKPALTMRAKRIGVLL
ncbi:MAG: hypothetical protein MK171_02955 [Pirellulales bacterium]|nr:hypothetical protein [Pirellulales bacterium]